MRYNGYIIVTVQFKKEGKKWVAVCNELGTSTFGRSLKEVKKRLNEAILLHLNTLDDVNERERFFKENKIIFYSSRPKTKSIPVSAPLDDNIFVQSHLQPVPYHPAYT